MKSVSGRGCPSLGEEAVAWNTCLMDELQGETKAEWELWVSDASVLQRK